MTRPVSTPKPAATPQSTRRSACLDLRPYVLKWESLSELESLGQAIVDQFKPATALEECIVRTIILALWNNQRWAKLETSLLNSASDAITLFRSPAATALLKMIQRRLTSEDSRHYRSLAELRRLQKERQMAAVPAAAPPVQPTETKPIPENWVRSSKSINPEEANPELYAFAANISEDMSYVKAYQMVQELTSKPAK
jgi:hypothetical protein